MFSVLKKNVGLNFEKLIKDQATLFTVEVDRDKIWEIYLNNFPEEHKQEHNCNCCKSFLRQYSGICVIQNNIKRSIWDNIEVPEKFINSIKAVKEYIHSLPISNVFLNPFPKMGNSETPDKVKNIIWNHFYLELPKRLVYKGADSIDSTLAVYRDNKNVLKRSLDELTLDAAQTILELIGQNSLYRGKEFEGIIRGFHDLKTEYNTIPNDLKDNYTWIKSTQVGGAMCKIRNTSIGTLLVDLSEGRDLDEAVSAFERVVAPTNYKRPTSLVTPKMVEEAKAKLTELGLLNSLERRYATAQDLSVENLLFVDKSYEVKDVFAEMSKETIVNPKSLTKIEEIAIEDFINNILPNSKSVEVLLENNHLSNTVSLLTANDNTAPTLFKWNNPFSWSYTGGITDSMKERVKAAGGKVDGVLRFSIQWNEDGKSIIDLDAHAHEPNGTHIYYGSYKARPTTMGGMLDVDMINPSKIGVENITWPILAKMCNGMYKFRVHNFSGHKNFDGVRCEIEFDGQLHEFAINKPFLNYIDVAEVNYQNGVFTIKSLLDNKLSVNTKEKWGIKTNQFTKVRNVMLSPNHWGEHVGNKHYFFMLDGCINDEGPRPFFNEFLKEDLTKDRKVLEIMGSKLSIPANSNQLSGVGFSDTQRNHLIVRVNGSFKRNLKLIF